MNAKRMVAALCLLAACSDDQPVDLGSDMVGQQPSGLSEFSGSWDGYAEAYNFDDGKDRVRLTVDASGNGTIQFGDSTTSVPAANVGYPRTYVFDSLSPGFAYPFAGASVSNDRLQASWNSLQYFSPYCSQLTPIAYGGGRFGCAPEITMEQALTIDEGEVCYVSNFKRDDLGGGINEEVPGTRRACGVYDCSNRCSCDAQGCGLLKTVSFIVSTTGQPDAGRQLAGDGTGYVTSPDAGSQAAGNDAGIDTTPDAGVQVVENTTPVSFDGALQDNGQKLVGTIAWGTSDGTQRITVRLNRQ